jgi:hypothetical protein
MLAKGQLNQPGAAVDEARLAWRARARFRWMVTAVFGGITVFGVLVLSSALLRSSPTQGLCPSPGCPVAEPGQAWTAITALGTFAAGVGTLVSAIAAVLALRAAAAARTATAAPAKRSSVKRARKRKRA